MSNYGFTSAGTSYDDEDRLTGFARASGTFTQSWSLTSVGDWNSITTNGTAQNRTHFLTHLRHLCPDCSPAVLSSTLTPQTSRLSYDFDNKLKSADVDNNGSNDVTFQYDALGRRVARQGTSGSFVYVQHDQQTIADYGYGDAPSSPTHRYVCASYIDEPVVRKAAGTSGTIYYYHRNQQYSITAVTTSSGSVAERYAYTAYGQPTILDGSGSVLSSSAINNRYTYTGREWDSTLGLYHFRARWMSGLAGRFMGRDPVGYFGSPFGLYRQFQGYALVVLDPHGSELITAGAVGVGGVIVAGGTSTTTVLVSGGTSTLVGGTTIGGSVGTGSGIIGIVSTGGAAATGGGTAAAVGGSTAAGGGTVLISGGLATTVGVAVLPGGILGYGIYATPVIGTQNWLEPGLTQVAYYFFPSNHPPIQTSAQPRPIPVPVPLPISKPKCPTDEWDPDQYDYCLQQAEQDYDRLMEAAPLYKDLWDEALRQDKQDCWDLYGPDSP
ncbi:RHS repeat-associated core domain-containing protein [Pirellulaceae bacterium SH467]